MKDLKAELEKLLTNAEDCTLIARLASDKNKRETFARIAKQLRQMAVELQADIAARSRAEFFGRDARVRGLAVALEELG